MKTTKKVKKLKISQRDNGTRRVQTVLDGKTMTDQSYKNSSDINMIIAQAQKTGVLPPGKQGQYLDISNIPDFAQAFEVISVAQEMFSTLPADIRKDMDNDPTQLERYINDPKNRSKLVEHGLLHPSEEIGSKDSSPASNETVQKTEEAQ